MSVDFALVKLKNSMGTDLQHFLSTFPTTLGLRIYQVKGTSGGATGQPEYVGYAPADALLGQPRWLIRKNIYDSAGFMTQSILANGNFDFNLVFDSGSSEYAAYTYTTT